MLSCRERPANPVNAFHWPPPTADGQITNRFTSPHPTSPLFSSPVAAATAAALLQPGADGIGALPLLDIRPGLALLALDGVEHDLVGDLGVVAHEALGPVVADGVGEDVAAAVERRGRDAAADRRVPLEPVLGVLVPEVERAVATGRAEGPVLRVERDVVDGVDLGRGPRGRVPVALEGEVGAVW